MSDVTPCPFCGESDGVVIHTRPDCGGEVCETVECEDCGGEAPKDGWIRIVALLARRVA